MDMAPAFLKPEIKYENKNIENDLFFSHSYTHMS